MNKKRLLTLDALRGLSALAVVLYHYTTAFYHKFNYTNELGFTFNAGKYGVISFFIISGFVIFMSLERLEHPIDFVAHRFIRLYPIFWVAVLFTFTIVSIFGLPGREVSFKDMVLNLTMLAPALNIPSVDGVYWTLVYELKFYFFMLILFWFNLLDKIEFIALTIIIIVIFCKLFDLENIFLYKVFKHIFMLNYLFYFIIGIMLYKIYTKKTNKLVYLVLVLSMYLGLVIDPYNSIFALLIIYFLFILLVLNKLNWIALKPLIFLGTISYSLYLIHQNFGYIILRFFKENGYSLYLGTILAIFLSIVIASIMTFYIEQPLIKFLKNKYKEKREAIIKKVIKK